MKLKVQVHQLSKQRERSWSRRELLACLSQFAKFNS